MRVNKNVIAGLAVVAGGIVVFAPNLIGAALPLLVIAACPLMMIFMMRGMSGMSGGKERSDSTDDTSEATSTGGELADLRAEVERLRAERAPRAEGMPADNSLN